MTPEERAERIALVALLRHRTKALPLADLVAEVVSGGSAAELWRRLNSETLVELPDAADPLAEATGEIDGWLARGIRFVTILDRDYPALLRGVHDAPPILFYRGSLSSDDHGMSVVGSRQASERGLQVARGIAESLVGIGLTVISGLALGIDAAAHRAALDAGGRTVAVVGTGITRAYPAANRELQEEIAQKGLVLSQFWPDAPPHKHTFPMRNATMSGYGLATVVVEAGEQSGARIQARLAVAHGRPVILTDLVVERNTWAKELVGRPGVHVAAGVRDLTATAQRIVNEQRAMSSELHRLVSA